MRHLLSMVILGLLLVPTLASAADPPWGTEPDVRPRLAAALPAPPPPASPGPVVPHAEFTPEVDQLVAGVFVQRVIGRVAELSGASPVTVGGEPETLVTRYTHSPMAVTAGYWLREQFEALGYPVELQWFTTGSSTVANVVATKPGAVHPEEIYVVGAHYDSRSGTPLESAPGANDNASGTAAVLEAARVMAGASCEATVQFVCFAAEEQGLVGSYEFVDRAVAAGDSIAGAIIMDMVAYVDDSYGILVEGGLPWAWLMDVMVASCERYTGLATQENWYSWGSDHVPFQEAGIAAFLAIEEDWDAYGCYHRTCDVLSLQHAAMLADVTRAAVGAAGGLARVVAATSVAALPQGAGAAPPALALSPNPSSATVRFDCELPATGPLSLGLFDAGGRKVADIAAGSYDAGALQFSWRRPADLASGVYFAVLRSPAGESVRRLVIAR